MKYALGVVDWLFGAKTTITLPNGREQRVSVQWFEKMKHESLHEPILGGSRLPPDGMSVNVHMIGAVHELTYADLADVDSFLRRVDTGYRMTQWTVGVEVSAEEVARHWDVETESLYVLMKIVDGDRLAVLMTRDLFDRSRKIT